VTRYVLLKIEDDAQAELLIRDTAVWPDSDLLSPCQENRVGATIVDLSALAFTDRNGIGQSYREYSTAAADYERGTDMFG
jgi:hypothetical protein